MEDGASLRFLHFEFPSGGAYAHLRVSSDSFFAGDGAENSSFPFYFYRLGSHVNVSQQPLGRSYKVVSCTYGSCTFTYYYGGFIGVGHGVDGHFTKAGRGFIGFRFNTDAGVHYGWVRVKTSGQSEYDFIVLDYAWGDPGEAIETGQKRSKDNEQAVTKTGSLGLLATGATGLKAWRQQRGAGTP